MSQNGFTGAAVTLEWPDRGIALARMTREREMNTLSLDLIGEMGRALDEAAAGRARVLIVTGSGRAFCCGAHLKYFAGDSEAIGKNPLEIRDNYLGRIAALYDRFEDMPFPIIAAVNGYALGGGGEMAISCDVRLMARSAVFGLPEVKLGATPGAGGVQKLARLVGRGKALEWILFARHVGAEEALAHGAVNEVCDDEALLDIALERARELRRLSPRALQQAKKSVLACEDLDLANARRLGLEMLISLIGSRDWQEGMAAFNEKRPPKFEEWD